MVYIRAEEGRGTGWVWNLDRGLIVSNAHVVGSATELEIGNNGEFRPARVIGSAPCEDLAVIKVDDTAGLRRLKIGNQSELKIGTPVTAIGYPAAIAGSRGFDDFSLNGTDGTVSNPRTSLTFPDATYPNVVTVTARINDGQSGGPLFNLKREVVGVTSLTNFEEGGNSVEPGAIGIDRVKEIAPRLEAGENVC